MMRKHQGCLTVSLRLWFLQLENNGNGEHRLGFLLFGAKQYSNNPVLQRKWKSLGGNIEKMVGSQSHGHMVLKLCCQADLQMEMYYLTWAPSGALHQALVNQTSRPDNTIDNYYKIRWEIVSSKNTPSKNPQQLERGQASDKLCNLQIQSRTFSKFRNIWNK